MQDEDRRLTSMPKGRVLWLKEGRLVRVSTKDLEKSVKALRHEPGYEDALRTMELELARRRVNRHLRKARKLARLSR